MKPARKAEHLSAVPSVGDSLAPTQARMLDAARSAGLSLDDAFGRLGEIIKNGEPEVALQGIKALFDYTTGRAPSNARTLNMHVTGKNDRFFDAATFEKPPAIKIED